MERRTVVRILKAIRRRKGWTQAHVAARIGISQSEMSRRELDALENCSVADVERWASALNAHLVLEVRAEGERAITDRRHAALQNWLVGLLRQHGWVTFVEQSFNHFGDRGRIDVVAYHPTARVLLIVEIKTRLDDAQELLGRLDVKRRIAPTVAAEHGWEIAAVVPMVLFRENSATRRQIREHAGLFERFELRARSAIAWLRQPGAPMPSGVLLFAAPG